MEVGFRQGWGPDSRPKPPEKALVEGGGRPRLHASEVASALPLALGSRG